MKYIKYIALSVTGIIVLTILTVKLYFQYDTPSYSGVNEVEELQDTVEVFTDSYGVPHIFANNNEDLFFTAGYIIARERLFQLSLLATVTRGEISKLLGDYYLEHDDYIKQNKLFLVSDSDSSEIRSANELLIQAYCSGINAWIDETEDSLPPSFKMLNTKPIRWTTSDVINVGAMETNAHHKKRQVKWFISTINQYFGEAKLLELLSADTYSKIQEERGFSVDRLNEINFDIENETWELIGATSQLLPSNVMIVSPEQAASNKPILIFDDIWGLQQPAKWYDISLNGGDFNIEGSVIPGFPVPLVGKSNITAWALTEQLTVKNINGLFDIAKDEFANRQNSLPRLPFSYAETSGAYRNNKEPYNQFKLLQPHLAALDKVDVNDIIDILAEVKNPQKVEIAQKINKIYRETNLANGKPTNLLYGRESDIPVISAGALLLDVVYAKLLENIFMDEFSLAGKDIFNTFVDLPIISKNSIDMILNNSESSWIDNIKTVNHRETLAEIIQKSVDDALVEIEKKYGTNVQNWRQAKTNTIIYKHTLYKKPFFAELFNLSVKSGKTYNSQGQTSDLAIRRIFDLSDININYSALPTGQSGLPKSIHYDDQKELFREYKFRRIESDEATIRSSNQYKKLILYPSE